ncbi:MAG: TlpA family protein disulfide reductase [Terriglobia bacterium]
MARPQATLALLLLVFCFSRPPEATSTNNGKLLFFTAPWCEPCHKMKPLLANLAKKYKVQMIPVDFDSSPPEVQDFKVDSLPTIVLLDSKGQLVLRAEGASKQTMNALTTALKTLEMRKANSSQGR